MKITNILGIDVSKDKLDCHLYLQGKALEEVRYLHKERIAICAVRFDSGLKAKYHQKVGEGKPKMSVLNIIRAKLIERIFTVVKRGSPYEIRLAA